jgi:serine/threonine protein kinase
MSDKIINDRFELSDKVGEGGFGEVFLVYDRAIKDIYALKVIRKELASIKQEHDRFLQKPVFLQKQMCG